MGQGAPGSHTKRGVRVSARGKQAAARAGLVGSRISHQGTRISVCASVTGTCCRQRGAPNPLQSTQALPAPTPPRLLLLRVVRSRPWLGPTPLRSTALAGMRGRTRSLACACPSRGEWQLLPPTPPRIGEGRCDVGRGGGPGRPSWEQGAAAAAALAAPQTFYFDHHLRGC